MSAKGVRAMLAAGWTRAAAMVTILCWRSKVVQGGCGCWGRAQSEWSAEWSGGPGQRPLRRAARCPRQPGRYGTRRTCARQATKICAAPFICKRPAFANSQGISSAPQDRALPHGPPNLSGARNPGKVCGRLPLSSTSACIDCRQCTGPMVHPRPDGTAWAYRRRRRKGVLSARRPLPLPRPCRT